MEEWKESRSGEDRDEGGERRMRGGHNEDGLIRGKGCEGWTERKGERHNGAGVILLTPHAQRLQLISGWDDSEDGDGDDGELISAYVKAKLASIYARDNSNVSEPPATHSREQRT